jgi:uncharacterized OsmC-like protein
MTGLMADALEARKIPSHSGQLESRVEGFWEETKQFTKLTRIHVHYIARIPPGTRPAAERALSVHDRTCSVSNSVRPTIEVTYDAEFIEVGSEASAIGESVSIA